MRRSQLLAFDDSETAGADEALDVVGPVISWLLVASPFIGEVRAVRGASVLDRLPGLE